MRSVVTRLVRRAARQLGMELRREPSPIPLACASLRTKAARPRGNVLISYIVKPFLHPHRPPSISHTHFAESLIMARTFLDLGFNVDVIDYRNDVFEPRKSYDVLVGSRTNFDRLARQMPQHCLKIAHLDTSHFLFNNQAALTRALDLQRRRGVVCLSIRLIEANRAIENADVGAMIGNSFTAATFAYAGKPMFLLPGPATATYPFPVEKDYDACRRRFLWFGSSGFVHKGLDLVLEAFAGLPTHELYVAGPLAEDAAFRAVYRRELYELPNIHTVGWLDVTTPRFLEITNQCLALVFPSCAESLSISSATCMHAGLIPVLTREAGVDLHDYGVLLRQATVDEIRAAVVSLSERPVAELGRMARAAWNEARVHHTRERYAAEYRQMLNQLLGLRTPTARAPVTAAIDIRGEHHAPAPPLSI